VPVPAAVTLMPLFYSRSTIEPAAGEGTKADGRAAFTEGRLFCLCVRLRHRSPRKFQRADVLIEVFVNSTRAFEGVAAAEPRLARHSSRRISMDAQVRPAHDDVGR
jgi:hypothetical protein